MCEIIPLSFVDVQHDAVAVFDDVAQNTVQAENVWVSAYKEHAESVHGKLRVERDEGKVVLSSSGGVEVQRNGNTLSVSVPSLDIVDRPVQFPAQILGERNIHINALDYSAKSGLLVAGGEDGYAAVINPASGVVPLQGHVGDVLSVKWFPSGEVVLTASSDLTIRVYSAKDGVNPRTLKGHTRAITSLAIIGVGREVLSASKDGTVRLWNVGEGKEVRKWVTGPGVEAMAVVPGEELGVLGVEGDAVITASVEGTISAFSLGSDSTDPIFTITQESLSKLSCLSYSPEMGLIATGHANGVVELRKLSTLRSDTKPTKVRRNESTILSLAFDGSSLLVGTASGLPGRLSISSSDNITATSAEEYAGWEAVAVEAWAVGPHDVFCAGTEGGIRRYKAS